LALKSDLLSRNGLKVLANGSLWFGGIIELVGGLMVMLGFQTRAAAYLCSGTVAVAYIQYH